MELRDYIHIIRKRWVFLAFLALIGLGAAAIASLLATPRYEARTLSFVSVRSGDGQDLNNSLQQGVLYTQNIVRSFAEAVNSPAVLDPVIADADLQLHETASDLGKDVRAKIGLETVNITIAVTRDDPVEAANIANAVTASFRAQASELTRPAPDQRSPVLVTTVTPAAVPDAPVSPRTKLNLAAGLLAGLALGIGCTLLQEVLDTRIRGVRQVRDITQAPVLGEIAYDEVTPKRPLFVQSEPTSPRSEAFRSLRTNLQFLDVEGGPRAFVVTSSIPGEGKTTTAANLAVAMSQSGLRTLVVDADLRDPSLANIFGIEGAVGLTDVLIGNVALEDATQTWGVDGLIILPAGRIPPNPSELLGSKAMLDLLRSLEQTYDAVLIDTPPLLPVTDAALLSAQVRGALVVIAAGRTHTGELQSAIESLKNVGAHVAGLVITMLPAKAMGYANYGYRSSGPTDNRLIQLRTPQHRLSPDRPLA